MTRSVTTLALFLTILSTPALGDDFVVADEEASAPILDLEETATTETVEEPTPTEDELAQYDRLFGSIEMAPVLTAADAKTIASVGDSSVPWWGWPLGLLAIGALLFMRGRATKMKLPTAAIRIVSRQAFGKDGSLALIEVSDGDERTRRLIVGLGGGAPRLVADISAWDVAVAAPGTMVDQAMAIPGPDPMPANLETLDSVVALDDHREPKQAQPTIALAMEVPRPAASGFGAHLYAAQQAADPAKVASPSQARVALIEEVLAVRDQARKESVPMDEKQHAKPAYSSREILA